MKYFRLMRAGIETAPFLAELSALSDAWSIATGRQDKVQVQREAMAVPLRGVRRSAIGDRARRDVHESRWTSTAAAFPHARAFLKRFSGQLGCELGRAKLVLLPAGRRVYPHVDRGDYYRIRDRYHLVLSSTDGSWLRAGDEEITMREGELWWFDNKALHEAWNQGDRDRIHLIFDLKPVRLPDAKQLQGASDLA